MLPADDPRAPSDRHAPSWYAGRRPPSAPAAPLAGPLECEFCVVGAGFTGTSAALHLARAGRDVVVLEQSLVGWGASGRNGGQVHVGMRRDQPWLEARLGVPTARALWRLALDAREHLDWLVEGLGIDCDFRPGLLHADHKPRYVAHTRDYVRYLNDRYDYPHVRFLDREQVRAEVATDEYHGGMLDARAGHLDPLALVRGIGAHARSAGARLYERTPVTALARDGGTWRIATPAGEVRAAGIVLAGDGYLHGLAPEVESRVMPINNFIAVTEPLGAERARSLIPRDVAVADSRFVVNYYRTTADHRLLFGGGETYSFAFPADVGEFVRPHFARVFPSLADVRIDYAWGGAVSVTPHRLPYVRELAPGLVNASGYSGLGVVLAPYTGKILAEALLGERREFELLAGLPVPRFPGGRWLRRPTLVAAMTWYALRDRL